MVTKLDLDPVDELRMRCWARQHYVPAEERDNRWHPIILEEMRRKDDERMGVALAG